MQLLDAVIPSLHRNCGVHTIIPFSTERRILQLSIIKSGYWLTLFGEIYDRLLLGGQGIWGQGEHSTYTNIPTYRNSEQTFVVQPLGQTVPPVRVPLSTNTLVKQ